MNSKFKAGRTVKGKASWYGDYFHGKKTASGEKYNMYNLTAASKTLPFGTIVRVKNLANGKSVKVKINDRGPYVEGRMIDLSRAAFKKIAPLGAGVLNVEVTILDTSKTFRYKH
jgi:rare lipoprotein A